MSGWDDVPVAEPKPLGYVSVGAVRDLDPAVREHLRAKRERELRSEPVADRAAAVGFIPSWSEADTRDLVSVDGVFASPGDTTLPEGHRHRTSETGEDGPGDPPSSAVAETRRARDERLARSEVTLAARLSKPAVKAETSGAAETDETTEKTETVTAPAAPRIDAATEEEFWRKAETRGWLVYDTSMLPAPRKWSEVDTRFDNDLTWFPTQRRLTSQNAVGLHFETVTVSLSWVFDTLTSRAESVRVFVARYTAVGSVLVRQKTVTELTLPDSESGAVSRGEITDYPAEAVATAPWAAFAGLVGFWEKSVSTPPVYVDRYGTLKAVALASSEPMHFPLISADLSLPGPDFEGGLSHKLQQHVKTARGMWSVLAQRTETTLSELSLGRERVDRDCTLAFDKSCPEHKTTKLLEIGTAAYRLAAMLGSVVHSPAGSADLSATAESWNRVPFFDEQAPGLSRVTLARRLFPAETGK